MSSRESIWPTIVLTASALVLAWIIAVASCLLTVRRGRLQLIDRLGS